MLGKLVDAESNLIVGLSGAKVLGQHDIAEKAQQGLTNVMQLKLGEKLNEVESDTATSGND